MVTAGLSAGFAGGAHAEACTNVEGNGVCTFGYTPNPTVSDGIPVVLGIAYCVNGECHPAEEQVASVPTVENEGGTVACVQISGTCRHWIGVPTV